MLTHEGLGTFVTAAPSHPVDFDKHSKEETKRVVSLFDVLFSKCHFLTFCQAVHKCRHDRRATGTPLHEKKFFLRSWYAVRPIKPGTIKCFQRIWRLILILVSLAFLFPWWRSNITKLNHTLAIEVSRVEKAHVLCRNAWDTYLVTHKLLWNKKRTQSDDPLSYQISMCDGCQLSHTWRMTCTPAGVLSQCNKRRCRRRVSMAF